MKELENNIENRLDHLKKGQPYKVPEDYFETFQTRLKDRMEAEARPTKSRFLLYLKPALGLAASFALVFLLVYVPMVKFMPGKGYMAQQKTDSLSVDTTTTVPSAIFAYFSEGQFLSAFEDIDDYDTESISTEALAEYLAINCSEYEIIKESN